MKLLLVNSENWIIDMSKQINALKQALEWYDSGKEDRQEFETLMRRLLVEKPAQQEGSVFTFGEVERTMLALKTGTFEQQQAYEVMKNKPLYTSPQPAPATELREQQEPKPKFVRNVDGVPCITLVEHEHLMRSRPQPAQQEPVACLVETEQGAMVWPIADINEAGTYCEENEFPILLYTSPQPAQQQSAERGEPVGKWIGDCVEWTENPYKFRKGQPLYTSPQPSPSQSDIKPWVNATTWRGLTREDKKEIERVAVYVDGAIRLTEAKLHELNEHREKNA